MISLGKVLKKWSSSIINCGIWDPFVKETPCFIPPHCYEGGLEFPSHLHELRWGSCVLLGPCHSSSFFPVPLPNHFQAAGRRWLLTSQESSAIQNCHMSTACSHPWDDILMTSMACLGTFCRSRVVWHELICFQWQDRKKSNCRTSGNEHFADFWPFLPTYYPPEKYHIPFQRFGGICFRFLESGISTLSQTSRLIWNSRILKGISWVFLYFCCFQGYF